MKSIRKLLELPDKAKCVAIPTGGEHDQMKWVYFVRRDRLQSALEAADLLGLVERVESMPCYLRWCYPNEEIPIDCEGQTGGDKSKYCPVCKPKEQSDE